MLYMRNTHTLAQIRWVYLSYAINVKHRKCWIVNLRQHICNEQLTEEAHHECLYILQLRSWGLYQNYCSKTFQKPKKRYDFREKRQSWDVEVKNLGTPVTTALSIHTYTGYWEGVSGKAKH